jgi:hypothetical protein
MSRTSNRPMTNTTEVRLWLIRETDKARLYSRVPQGQHEGFCDDVWVPLSVIEGCRKMPAEGNNWPEHHVRIQDWFIEK